MLVHNWHPMQKAAIEEAEKLGYEIIIRTSAPNETQKNEKHLGFPISWKKIASLVIKSMSVSFKACRICSSTV